MKTKLNSKTADKQRSYTAISKEAKMALAIGAAVNVGAVVHFLYQKNKLKNNIK
jgi:hypothetical protein